MSIANLRLAVDEIRRQASPPDVAIVDALVETLDRFSESEPNELVAALAKLKPKKKKVAKKASTKKPEVVATALIESYATQLRAVLGDIAGTTDVMKKIRADKAVKKNEAIALAQAVGIGATSKTTKVQALIQIEGMSHQLERDSVTAERIRKGA
ncbi:MAG: hypothetical protein HOP13_13880 [Alphaproteobacteria bacterium]|nr:hypothetical protein [Alphaproteobacteria bacterium]